jgi:flagellar hook-associated protein 2
MSTSGINVGASTASQLTITGLASGLNTPAIIQALMGAEREPVVRLTNEETKLQAQQKALQGLQSSLQQLSFAAGEFVLPSLFESSQTVTSSEPTRVSAATTAGAAIGGHEVEVTKLANSAQRTFSFTSPAAEDKLTIDGHEFTIKAGATAKEVAGVINSNTSSTVFAAVVEGGAIALSNRATGNTGAEFIKVSDPAGALTEVAGSAKEGQNAEYKIDGVAGTGASNTITGAIPGVTLTLTGLTTTGPVTIDVQPPGVNPSAVEAQMQAFVKSYNAAVEAVEKQLQTKPPTSGSASPIELATGTLFSDFELGGLVASMRQAMYEPIAGLPAEMSSPADVGLSTGAPSSGGASQASIEGLLTLNPTKLSEAIKANPAAAQKMLQQWSQKLQTQLQAVAAPGGSLEARVTGDGAQVTELTRRIATMDELLLQREKALQQTYARLEGTISNNNSQATWLANQSLSLNSSSSSSGH